MFHIKLLIVNQTPKPGIELGTLASGLCTLTTTPPNWDYSIRAGYIAYIMYDFTLYNFDPIFSLLYSISINNYLELRLDLSVLGSSLWAEAGVEGQLEALDQLVLAVDLGRQIVVGGPFLGKGDAMLLEPEI